MVTGSRRIAVGIALLLTGAATAAEPPRTSWGRADVGFDQYRTDAIACGRAGLGTDIADLKAVKTLAAASQQIDTLLQVPRGTVTADGTIDPVALNTAQQVARTVESANPRARIKEVRAALLSTVEQCLTARGYVRFDLTDEQRRQLRVLKPGSPERHAYLHALASNPGVLERQRAAVRIATP